MKGVVAAVAFGATVMFSAATASAATFTGEFLGAGTTWNSNFDSPPIHYFYFDGARADQAYASTGLSEATSLELDVNYTRNSHEDLTFTFSLNGVDIGTWLLPSSMGSSVPGFETLNFSFGPVAATAGASFALGMRVTDGVCSGCGNVSFLDNQPATLRLSDGAVAAIPEPATWAMMILGFGAAGAMIRRRVPLAQPL